MARPLLRDGRFDGAVHVLVSTDFLAEVLARLELSPQDMVGLVHPDGRILARSLNNPVAMQQEALLMQPFVADRQALRGSFRQVGVVDGVPRLFGWQRMLPTGAVVVVGLAESGVLAPLHQARQQALGLTVGLTLVLVLVGGWIGWLQWRLTHGQNDMQRSREQLQQAQRMAQLGHWTFDAGPGA